MVIKERKSLLLGPEEQFLPQMFKEELRKGKLTLWNALHIAAVHSIYDHTFCLVSDSGGMANTLYLILTYVFAADTFRKFFSLCTSTNLFSFDCCYDDIIFHCDNKNCTLCIRCRSQSLSVRCQSHSLCYFATYTYFPYGKGDASRVS